MSGAADASLTAAEGDAVNVAADLVRQDLAGLDPALAGSVLSTELVLTLLARYQGDVGLAGAHAHRMVDVVIGMLNEAADRAPPAVH